MNANVIFFLKFKKDVRFFYDTLTLRQALPMMKQHGYTAVPVINSEGEYVGSLSEGDLLWTILENGSTAEMLDTMLVRDLIRPGFMPAVNISVPFQTLLETSFDQNYVPVVDDRNIFIGIVTRQTLMKYLAQKLPVQPSSPELALHPSALEEMTEFQIQF